MKPLTEANNGRLWSGAKEMTNENFIALGVIMAMYHLDDGESLVNIMSDFDITKDELDEMKKSGGLSETLYNFTIEALEEFGSDYFEDN